MAKQTTSSMRVPKADAVDGYQPTPSDAADDAPPSARWDEVDFDGFVNELTGAGVPGFDKSMGGRWNGPRFHVRLFSGVECADRWRGSDLGKKIVETLPGEMTRAGFDLTVQPEDDEQLDLTDQVRSRAQTIATERRDRMRLDRASRRSARRAERKSSRRRGDEFPTAAPKIPPQKSVEPEEVEAADEGQALVEAFKKKHRELGTMRAFKQALNYERAYGGGAILMGADDSGPERVRATRRLDFDEKTAALMRCDALEPNDPRNLTAPLDESKIKTVSYLNALRGGWDGEVIAWRYYNDPRSPKYGMPEIYQVRNLGVPISSPPAPDERIGPQNPTPVALTGVLIFYVHESRLLIFPGQAVDHRTRVQMRGWGDSVFVRVDEVLSEYGQTWSGIASLMQDFAQGVLKMKGLAEALLKRDTGDGKSGAAAILARARMNDLTRSVFRLMLLDSDEEFKREVASLAGVADVLEQMTYRVAAAADTPAAFIFGQRSGLNATGDADTRSFYDRVQSSQEADLIPLLMRLYRLLFVAKDSPTGGREPRRWEVRPRPLWQMTAQEQANLRKTQMEIDTGYITAQVLESFEVTASRFGGSEYSTDTKIDLDARADMQAAEEELAARQPPPPAPGDPAPRQPGQPGNVEPTPGQKAAEPDEQGPGNKVTPPTPEDARPVPASPDDRASDPDESAI